MKTGKPLRALVIDDEAPVRDVMARMLEAIGCEVLRASCAAEALDAFLSGPFDLLTLDYSMPGMTGMELHKVLSQEFGAGKRTTGFVMKKLPPILIVTAYAEDPGVVRGQFGEGIVGVLQKPVTMEDLKRVVDDLPDTAPVGRGRPPKVLVIDDEAEMRNIISRALRSRGMEVVTAADAGQAVARFLEGGVDLITLDQRMPGICGTELHGMLSGTVGAGKRTPRPESGGLPPILIVTGAPEDRKVILATFGESVVGVLPKPFDTDTLIRAVEEALAHPERRGRQAGMIAPG